MKKQILEMFGLCSLLLSVQLLVWGCTPLKTDAVTIAPVPISVCAGEMVDRVAGLEADTVGSFLQAAEQEGGAACWSEAVQAALIQGKPVPPAHLVKALDAFNRNATAGDFHRAVGQYLRGLADGDGSYTQADQRLLEAYSRYVIRTANSQDDNNLQLAQMACARLDRALYARLFE